jgi:2'-5' RNA ligase
MGTSKDIFDPVDEVNYHITLNFVWRLERQTRHALAQLVEVLRWKPESRGFDTR